MMPRYIIRNPTIYETPNIRRPVSSYRIPQTTLYPWTGLLIKPALVGTHVDVRLAMEESLYSFLARRRLRPRSCLSGKPLVFPLIAVSSQIVEQGNRCPAVP